MSKREGKVIWYEEIKGFGFIAPKNTQEDDIFVHHSQIITDRNRKLLPKGANVEYDVKEGPDGREVATNVKEILDIE